MKKDKTAWLYFIPFLALGAQYLTLSLLAPTAAAEKIYNVSHIYFTLVKLTFIVPFFLTWALLLFGYIKVSKYVQSIEKSQEVEAFRLISLGLLILLIQSISNSFISFIASYAGGYMINPSVANTIKMISIYSSVVYGIIFHILFYLGSIKWLKSIKIDRKNTARKLLVIFLTIVGAVSYIYLIVNNPVRQMSTDPRLQPTYFVNDFMIFTTIAGPQILNWLIGGLTIVNFVSFEKNVPGIIYKKALKRFSFGLFTVVFISIFSQISGQFVVNLAHASLNTVLGLVYFALLVIGTGYWAMASGANKLAQIEIA